MHSKPNLEVKIKMELKGKPSRMAGLFLYAAIIQGAIAAVITFLGGFGDQIGLYPVSVSRVIAGGEAGTWFIMGYVMYIVVGVVAMAVTSLFYFYIETVQGKTYAGAAKALAWAHLVLANVGVAGVAILAMVGGYLGGAAMQPSQFGGMGWNTGQVHVNILQYYTEPIAAFLMLALLGFVLGGLGYILALRSK
jgi:vacuolar-type H+-ATPase subunit I/STV1